MVAGKGGIGRLFLLKKAVTFRIHNTLYYALVGHAQKHDIRKLFKTDTNRIEIDTGTERI